ncbi:MAG: cell division protein ZapB [Acidobacteria bacterium]|nr:cell division protein ZapB [Acidobacteriota bacterium]
MELPNQAEPDSLAALEERIRQTAELVIRLRRERDAAVAEKLAAEREAAEARGHTGRLSQELEALRAERAQVRTRIEKLLGQIDALAAS